MPGALPQVPYGAVYFRKTNPPRADWERDYRTAAEDGMNMFRHWFLWGAIETSPGQYAWEDYDRQMDLAADNGIGTIIAEFIYAVPEWARHRHSDALQVSADGRAAASSIGVSCATGGFGGSGVLCLDDERVKEPAGRFLRTLAARYKDHPAMRGYDVWNECGFSVNLCYCRHTKTKFRAWLSDKYGSLQALNEAWQRYSYTEWEQVEPPLHISTFTENMDWLTFRKENFYAQMQWRIDTIRSVDAHNLITAHGTGRGISNMVGGSDEWLAASKVDIYGFTWNASRMGNEPWQQWHAVDVVRSGARGKPFWHAEAQGGPLWLQPNVVGMSRSDGRVTEPDDLRLWNLTSLAGGARGLLYPRWRPLLEGPLFGAFGPYGMDGGRTARSEMAGRIARWANAPEQSALFRSSPIRGDIGILVVPETQHFDYLLNHESGMKLYAHSMWGAYRGFLDNHVQADWVHIDDMDAYDVLYYPYPIMFTAGQADRLRRWVAAGGTLICEGCPGYFGDRGKVGALQPNHGLHELFGAVQDDVEFMPDLDEPITVDYGGGGTWAGAGFKQSYSVCGGGKAVGLYAAGGVAAVEHEYGAGRTLLIGTFPSLANWQAGGGHALFAKLLSWAGKQPVVSCTNVRLQVRVQDGDGGPHVWIVNSDRQPQTGAVTLSGKYAGLSFGALLWGGEDGVQSGAAPEAAAATGGEAPSAGAREAPSAGAREAANGGQLVSVPGRDALIFALRA